MVHRFETLKSLSNNDLLINNIVFVAFIAQMIYMVHNVLFFVDTTEDTYILIFVFIKNRFQIIIHNKFP